MKILMLCDFYDSKVEYQENLLEKYYRKHGHSVVILASCFPSVFSYIENDLSNPLKVGLSEIEGTKIYRLKYQFNILNKLRYFYNIEKIVENEQPDLIFVHDIALNIIDVIGYLKRKPSAKLIMDYHADYSNSGKNWLSLKVLHGVIRKYFLTKAMPHISKIFPIVPASFDFLKEVYGVSEKDMELLPLAADIDDAMKIKKSSAREDLRKKYNVECNEVVVFTGGKLTPEKRTDILIKVFLHPRYKTSHLIIAGKPSPNEIAYYEELIALAEGRLNIHFAGWLTSNEIYQYLCMSDIAVFPSSQSVLWQKAITLGLPLLVGDSGGQDASYLSAHNNVIVLKSNQINEEELDKHLYEIVSDKNLRLQMADGAKKTTYEILDWNKLIQNTLRFNNPQAVQ